MSVLPATDADLTVGLEEEVFLVDRASLALAPCAAELRDRLDERYQLELPAAQIELVSAPAARVADVVADLAGARALLAERAGPRIGAIASAVHPLAGPESELGAGEHFAELGRTFRAVATRMLVGALHVHVAVSGAERSLAVYNALRSYLPELAALAANAPLQAGADTGLASVRPTIATMLPRQGVPPALRGWDDFRTQLEWGVRAGVLEDSRGWWWELRPSPTYGTLELRVPDVQISCGDTAAVAAFAHALVGRLAERHDGGETLPVHASWRIAENRWAACRDGCRGTMADLDSGAREPTRMRLERLLEDVAPVADRLGCKAELELAHGLLASGGGAARQRRIAAERGPDGLVSWLLDEFTAGTRRAAAESAASSRGGA